WDRRGDIHAPRSRCHTPDAAGDPEPLWRSDNPPGQSVDSRCAPPNSTRSDGHTPRLTECEQDVTWLRNVRSAAWPLRSRIHNADPATGASVRVHLRHPGSGGVRAVFNGRRSSAMPSISGSVPSGTIASLSYPVVVAG